MEEMSVNEITARVLLRLGEPLPVDLYIALTEEGIDPDELAEEYGL